MKLTTSFQVTVAATRDIHFDLVIAASGYERRCTHVAANIQPSATRRVALAFHDRRILSRNDNDSFFTGAGYEIVDADGASIDAVQQAIERAVRDATEDVNILVDYTGMTRVWYAGVIQCLGQLTANINSAHVYFTYAPSIYLDPLPSMPNKHMGPVAGFSNLALPDTPTALIVGLGYEPDRALGLTDYVEASETFALYAHPSYDQAFVAAVLKNNATLLRLLGPARVLAYPLADLRATAAQLSSLARGLQVAGFRVILAPLGPKPFALLCFLLAARYSGLDVWRVSSGVDGNPYDRAALGDILVCKATYIGTAAMGQTGAPRSEQQTTTRAAV